MVVQKCSRGCGLELDNKEMQVKKYLDTGAAQRQTNIPRSCYQRLVILHTGCHVRYYSLQSTQACMHTHHGHEKNGVELGHMLGHSTEYGCDFQCMP